MEKYGAQAPKSSNSKGDTGGGRGKGGGKRRDPKDRVSLPLPSGGRTGIPPPPTANIRFQAGSLPSSPAQDPVQAPLPPHAPPAPSLSKSKSKSALSQQEQQLQQSQFDEPGFAPNAFPVSQQYAGFQQSRWYDRLLDVLLGEDETLPKNRLALICAQCRLVNGQAAPGVHSPEELGRWRCGSCGAWNGEVSESKRMIDDIHAKSSSSSSHGHNRNRSQSSPLSRPPMILEPSTPSDQDVDDPISRRPGSVSSAEGATDENVSNLHISASEKGNDSDGENKIDGGGDDESDALSSFVGKKDTSDTIRGLDQNNLNASQSSRSRSGSPR